MDELIKVLAGAIGAVIDARNASDAEAEAAALAALDAAIEQVHPAVASLKDVIAQNRAEALAALKERFPEEETKP